MHYVGCRSGCKCGNGDKNIALTGDITPSVDTKLKFASAKESSDYMLLQMWYELDTERFFTDSDTLNAMIDEKALLPENERCFKNGTTYMYTDMRIELPKG